MIEKKRKVFDYYINNPIDETLLTNRYTEVCKKFNINRNVASKYWHQFKKLNIPKIYKYPEAAYTEKDIKKILAGDNNSLNVSINTDIQVKSLDDLLEICEVNSNEYEVVKWQCKKYDSYIKNNKNEIEVKPMYSVSAVFKPITVDTNINLQKDLLKKELLQYSKEVPAIKYNKNNKKLLLNLSLYDVHFGKLAHKEEVGEDYDLKIAEKRFKNAVEDLLSNVNINSIEKIVLPIGNDLIHVDNAFGTTTAGTRQDVDTRFHKIIKVVKTLLIDTINMLYKIAPVDIIGVSGNHDTLSSWMLVEMLEAYYYNNKNVNVYNTSNTRKYYKYGNTSFMFTHGDKEKFNELGMIFSAENPILWADTKHRYIHIGHYHHNKLQVLQKQEFQGFQVQILPSLSGNDAWHNGKGYSSLKQAKAFIYDFDKGLIGEFTHTVE